jgi:hypothetical protein
MSPAASSSGDGVRRVLTLLVIVFGLVVTDRLSEAAAQRDVAARIQASEHLPTRPDVDIHGFPFLTQLVRGRYDDVDVTVRGLHAGPVPIDHVTARLTGAEVPFGDVVRQRVGAVPIERARAEVLLRYDDLNDFVSTDHVFFEAGRGGRLHVTATAEVAGAEVNAGVDVPVVVSGSVLTVDVGAGVQVRIPLPGLPFHMRLNAAKATADGIVVAGSVDGLVLRP